MPLSDGPNLVDERIVDLSRAARALIAGPPDYLRVLVSDESEPRRQRRAIIVAALREHEALGHVGISPVELAADVEAVLRLRQEAIPDDLRNEIIDLLRQLEAWEAVDSAVAPERARMEGGLSRRVERDYSLARPMRVFLPYWDEIQRTLRRRYVSLSANYFAQAAAALEALLRELQERHPDQLHCYTSWQSARQGLMGVNRESRDFARELRSIEVDPNHPEALADIADRLGILYEKFYKVAHEGAAQVRERLVRLRDAPRDGQNVRRLQLVLRSREEEWSISLGESEEERTDRLDAIGIEVLRDLASFERLVAETGPGSWREGVRLISLALVELTERIHTAIALRLQQTQAIEALTRRARVLANSVGHPDTLEDETQSARRWLWNASGAVHAAMWVQDQPATDERVILDRWLENRGGSPLPIVDDETWHRSIMPRKRAAPPPPPPPLITADDWDAGDDPRMRQYEDQRSALVARLIAAGTAAQLRTLLSFDELRILAQLLWLPRDSSPLRRLGLRIAPPLARGTQRALVSGPGFELDMENYRFVALGAKIEVEAPADAKYEALAPALVDTPPPARRPYPPGGSVPPDVARPERAAILPVSRQSVVLGNATPSVSSEAGPTPGANAPDAGNARRPWPFLTPNRRSTRNPPLQKPQES